jgi:PAS domain S-box-containing protein
MIYKEFELVLNKIYDEITIADSEGRILRASKSCEKIFGISEKDMIGRKAQELEDLGLCDRSSTVIVLKTKKKETIIQTTASGKRLMVTGIPMFDSEGKLYRIINISRDITEIENLKTQLNDTELLLSKLQEEIYQKQVIKEKFIIGKSKAMLKIIDDIKQIAKVDVTVFILGETGVGKGLLAKTIHQMSYSRNNPFIQVNCGAIPENLLEAELFGYAEGAFTGAKKSGKKGLFEIAGFGTIFLDEISEMPINIQVKLLNALQEKEFIQVGDTKPIKLHARIISASNTDLKDLIKSGKLREDLFYRLNVIRITIPPLRERLEDIPILAFHFLDKYNLKYNKNKKFTSEAYKVLMGHSWPGNIRELENTIERLVVTCEDNQIDVDKILTNIDLESQIMQYEPDNFISLKKTMENYERVIIMNTLDKAKSTRKAAKILGIDQSTIVKKLNKYKE